MKKNGSVECSRFLAAMLIMTHHMYQLGVEEYPFKEAWIYVELFLLITGFYTARHYDGHSAGNPSKDAFQYTIRKFLPLFPYACISSVCGWILRGLHGLLCEGWIWKKFVINFLGDFPFDILLLISSYGYPVITPLWYLSAMLIVFPLFCLFVQIKNRYTKLLSAILLTLLFYGWNGVSGERTYPLDMLRVMAGMLLGVVIYEFSVVFKAHILRVPKKLLTVVEALAFAFPFFCCLNNYVSRGFTNTRVYLLCYCIFLLLCLPGFTYSAGIKGKLFDYLGRLSMPIFIFHWCVCMTVNLLAELNGWALSLKIILYYALTLLVSVVLMALIGRWRWWNGLLKKDWKLAD